MKTLVLLSTFSIGLIDWNPNNSNPIEKEALAVLEAKCNICHRKQNPFKIFNSRNMNRHASKIYTQVFVKKRMPKGDQIQLSDQEYKTLKEWLETQNID